MLQSGHGDGNSTVITKGIVCMVVEKGFTFCFCHNIMHTYQPSRIFRENYWPSRPESRILVVNSRTGAFPGREGVVLWLFVALGKKSAVRFLQVLTPACAPDIPHRTKGPR